MALPFAGVGELLALALVEREWSALELH